MSQRQPGPEGKSFTPLERRIYRLAAYFREWDVEGPNGWLSRISWDQLWRWIRYTDLEPVGDERADLRIGALASVIYNMNLDTRKTGVIQPYRYISGWSNDKVHMLAFRPEPEDLVSDVMASSSAGQSSADRTLNNPTVWENFKAGLRKVYGGKKP